MRKKRSRFKTFLIRSLKVLAILVAVLVAVIFIVSPGKIDADSPYHPFKSADAKERYLEFYDNKAKTWPVDSTSTRISTQYGETFVRISGPVGADSLVLLHGVGGNAFQWMPNIEELSAHFRVFAIDGIYGYGRTINTVAAIETEDYVNWLDELLEKLDLQENVNLVGLSYGGWIAGQYSLQKNTRLNKTVLIAPVGLVKSLSPMWMVRATLCIIPHRYFTHSFMYWLLEDLAASGIAGLEIVEDHVEESYLAIRSFKPALLAYPSLLSDEEIGQMDVPVLFLVGANEKLYDAEEAIHRLNRLNPGIKTQKIPGAGHDITVVQKYMVNQAILDFLL